MNFSELAQSRYSVRSFTKEPISNDDIQKILQAGHLAPTACNLQPQRIFVISSPLGIEKLKNCTRCHFDCTCAMLVCYNSDECWTRKYDGEQSGVIDASIVTTHMMLMATELNIGSTWVMHFNPENIKSEFDLPENIIPTALLVLGHPAPDAAPIEMHSKYRPEEEIVSFI